MQLYTHIKDKPQDIILEKIFSKDGYSIVHCVPCRHYIQDKKKHFPDRVYIHVTYSKSYDGYGQIHIMNLTQSPYFQEVYDKYHELVFCFKGVDSGKMMEYNDFIASVKGKPTGGTAPQSPDVFPVMVDIESPQKPVPPVVKPEPPKKKVPVAELGILDFD